MQPCELFSPSDARYQGMDVFPLGCDSRRTENKNKIHIYFSFGREFPAELSGI
jgi:hypothetical protein